MDRKLIFLDIDGTLVDAFAKPTERVVEALRKARENGHLLFLCTGRSMPLIASDIWEIGFDGVIASAGGHIEVGGNVVFDSLQKKPYRSAFPYSTPMICIAGLKRRRGFIPIPRCRSC